MRMIVRLRKLFKGLAVLWRVQAIPQRSSPLLGFSKFTACMFGLAALTPAGAVAATVSAASCSSADVQVALNRAAAGDTVSIPVGTCHWATGVTWTAPPNVTLQGAGSPSTYGNNDATVIIDDISRSGYDAPLLNITISGTEKFRMTGI